MDRSLRSIALQGDATAVRFTQANISDGRPDLSFSGLKTAVSRYVREEGIQPLQSGEQPSQPIMDLAASFQSAVIKALVGTMEKLAIELRPKTLIVAGGVACNNALRLASERVSERLSVPVYFPSKVCRPTMLQ